MKGKSIVASVIVAVSILLGSAIAYAWQAATVEIPEMPTFGWDPPTVNADGSPLTDLAGFVVVVTRDGEDPNTTGTAVAQLNVSDPAATQTIVDLTQLDPAIVYRAWVAAYDDAGNRSPFTSTASALRIDEYVPAAPANVRVLIKVIIEVQ